MLQDPVPLAFDQTWRNMMKEIAAISFAVVTTAVVATLASSNAFASWGSGGDYWDPDCWKKGYYDKDECREPWDPRYWMNEFKDMWNDDNDNWYRYGGFGGPMMGGPFGPYGGPVMPYGGGYGAPMMPYGPPMGPYVAPAPAAPLAAPAPAPVAPYGQPPSYAPPSLAPRPNTATK